MNTRESFVWLAIAFALVALQFAPQPILLVVARLSLASLAFAAILIVVSGRRME